MSTNPRPGDCTRIVRAKRRENVPNLSPSRPPSNRRDLKLWPVWTRVPLERIGFKVLDVDGTPISAGGGC